MFGLRKELELLKQRVEELDEMVAHQRKEHIMKNNYSMAVAEVLTRTIKYSKDGEPTYHFNNKLDSSEIFLYINKEEYRFTFEELRGYCLNEISVDRLVLKNNIAYLTITGTIDRHTNKPTKTYDFIIDYKHNKYILDNAIEIKKTYNLDEVKVPSK